MINRIQSYNIKNNYTPSFKSAVVKGARIPVRCRRGGVAPQNASMKFLSNLKEIFFEVFPKFDPEYKNYRYNKII